MREYQRRGGSLSRLPAGARALYGAFLGFVLLGLASSMALFYDSLGLTAQRASAWYLGNADDMEAAEILLEKSPRELLEVSHFHLFTQPVVLLVVAHLFLLSRGGPWKGWLVGAAVLSTLAHLAGPWLVRYGGPGWLMGATGTPLLVCYLVMVGWVVPDLLGRRGGEPPPPG